MKRFGIALSGGGHRASLFSLGVMLYLADADKLSALSSISSVSGSSITNGCLAQLEDLKQLRGAEFQAKCHPLAKALSQSGTLWAWCGTWVYLAATILLGTTALAWPWLVTNESFGAGLVEAGSSSLCDVARFAAALIGLSLVWHFLIKQRGVICRGALQATLLKDAAGSPTLLKDVAKDDCDHVICATEIHVGEHVYFSGRFVYSARLGCGTPDGLTLAHAVQASAAFPGGFMPTYLDAAPLKFQGGSQTTDYLALLDGGLYDNMADQWQFGLSDRKQRDNFSGQAVQECNELIVVNACTNMTWSSVATLSIPLVGEVLSLARTTNVLYDNTTTTRRRFLLDTFERNEKFSGALITLEQSPLRVPSAFAKPSDGSDPEQQARAERAATMLSLLEAAARQDSPNHESQGVDPKRYWQSLVDSNSSFPTTLRALGVRRSAAVIRQAYVTAMSNLHVVLGYPAHRIPTVDAIEAYLAHGTTF